MRKIALTSLIVLSILVSGLLTITTISAQTSGNYVKEIPIYTHIFTKAFCDESNFCQDYTITCNQKNIISIKATGFSVQFSDDWRDTRSQETITQFC